MKVNEDVVDSLIKLTTRPEGDTTLTDGSHAVLTVVGFIAMRLIKTFELLEVNASWAMAMFVLAAIAMAINVTLTSTKNVWKQVRPHVLRLIGQEIQRYHVESLESMREGLAQNMEIFQKVTKQFNTASDGDKEKMKELVRLHHNALLMFLRASMPQFQMEAYAVAALPEWAMAANIHIVMLATGIRFGKEWGYTHDFIEGIIRPEFVAKTGLGTKIRAVPKLPGTSVAALTSSNSSTMVRKRAGDKMQMGLLADAIAKGEAESWPAKLLETWKDAYSALSAPRHEVARGTDAPDYLTYAQDTYERGRAKVVPHPPDRLKPIPAKAKGLADASELRALADYDSIMIMHVLSPMEIWPYSTGEFEVPQSVYERMDREIFAGPYGRWGDTPWSRKRLPPVTPRGENITSIRVCFDESVTCLQEKIGDRWGPLEGSERSAYEHRLDLAPDEFVRDIDLTYGLHLGSLALTSDRATYGPFGTLNGTMWDHGGAYEDFPSLSVNRTGYGLSSIHLTKAGNDQAAEGIFFGFRPLHFASDTYVPTTNASYDITSLGGFV
ncbi:hypothetical protein V2A60_004376 [Cordyceps javanica]|uniref:Cry protein n=1 Tax=Cordyceps javanica TaxID=43265 RepID=A0A545URI5_9HYPO|nr:Cry protein [Cordyceps javanica]TQW04139.1 Cry protein [Cordyceps javanica]